MADRNQIYYSNLHPRTLRTTSARAGAVFVTMYFVIANIFMSIVSLNYKVHIKSEQSMKCNCPEYIRRLSEMTWNVCNSSYSVQIQLSFMITVDKTMQILIYIYISFVFIHINSYYNYSSSMQMQLLYRRLLDLIRFAYSIAILTFCQRKFSRFISFSSRTCP